MRKLYTIEKVIHSGRKGIRYEPVTDPKYDGLVGTRCYADFAESKQFQKMHFDIPSGEINCPYDWWDTSEILELKVYKETGEVFLETANTIYVLQEVDKDAVGKSSE